MLSAGRDFVAGTLPVSEFEEVLARADAFLLNWDADSATFPTHDPEWKLLAEAYRHACILRVRRFPEPLESVPAEDDRIKGPVAAILDAAAKIPMDSPFYKRLLFPLFLAGAETSSPHQYHYVHLCINQIKESTGFQHQAMTQLLNTVWEERHMNSKRWRNISWTEWVSNTRSAVDTVLTIDCRRARRCSKYNTPFCSSECTWNRAAYESSSAIPQNHHNQPFALDNQYFCISRVKFASPTCWGEWRQGMSQWDWLHVGTGQR